MRGRKAVADIRLSRDVAVADASSRLQVGQVVDAVRVVPQARDPGAP